MINDSDYFANVSRLIGRGGIVVCVCYPCVAADLCGLLAEITRSEPQDQGTIAHALTDAGLSLQHCDNARPLPQLAQHSSQLLADWKSPVLTTVSKQQVTVQP